MGKTRRQHAPERKGKAIASASSRRSTRSSKSRLATDPAQNTADLGAQLRQLGLYAADTLGDGNCLFRALSDQLYGTDAHHARLRQAVCDWIARHAQRYAPFVEDERGIETHLACMRTLATYGGHLELSAFAHMARRDVKVVQPGLVYVIEWAAGWDTPPSPLSASAPAVPDLPAVVGPSSRKAERRARKAAAAAAPPHVKQEEIEEDDSDDDDERVGPVYVAYHDWEHFSSIRNLRGPHAGLPRVRERPYFAAPSTPVAGHETPSHHPLPPSRTPSPPPPTTTPVPESPLTPLAPSPAPAAVTPYPYPLPAHLEPGARRSPKRAFDEGSSGTSASASSGSAKRARTEGGLRRTDTPADVAGEDADEAAREGTPALSDVSTLSSSPSPEPEPEPAPAPPAAEALTKRQRKALGLPRPRKVGAGEPRRSAGKIVIPGGRFRREKEKGAKDEPEEDAVREWVKSGAGRVDVRGFRELKI